TTSSISILEISVWASPDSLTSGSLVINELVALDLTTRDFFKTLSILSILPVRDSLLVEPVRICSLVQLLLSIQV
ncbi:hypothetical protein, partial [Streptococcus suis]|uniref:hypothetical protein n=1 Tax=Streptococcus suis TaxID=1307 RepID=UPI001EE74E10